MVHNVAYALLTVQLRELKYGKQIQRKYIHITSLSLSTYHTNICLLQTHSILCSVEKEGESKLISIFCIVQKVKNIRVFIWKGSKNRIRPQLFVALLRFILQVEKMKSFSFLLGKYF